MLKVMLGHGSNKCNSETCKWFAPSCSQMTAASISAFRFFYRPDTVCHWTSCVETLQVHIYVGPSKVLEFFQFLKPIYKGLESPLKQTGSMKFLGKRKDPWKSMNLSFISCAFRMFPVRTLANSVIQQFVMDYLCSKCCWQLVAITWDGLRLNAGFWWSS